MAPPACSRLATPAPTATAPRTSPSSSPHSTGSTTPARTARFRTVALVAWPDGSETVATGVVEGHIARVPAGDGGFGYDPVFVPVDGGGLSFAEMSDAAKNAISHRGRAFRALAVGLMAR